MSQSVLKFICRKCGWAHLNSGDSHEDALHVCAHMTEKGHYVYRMFIWYQDEKVWHPSEEMSLSSKDGKKVTEFEADTIDVVSTIFGAYVEGITKANDIFAKRSASKWN